MSKVKIKFTVEAEVGEGYLETYSSYSSFVSKEEARITRALPSFLQGSKVTLLEVGDVRPSNQQEPP